MTALALEQYLNFPQLEPPVQVMDGLMPGREGSSCDIPRPSNVDSDPQSLVGMHHPDYLGPARFSGLFSKGSKDGSALSPLLPPPGSAQAE